MTIYKYSVPGVVEERIAGVLDAQLQNGKIKVWCMIDEKMSVSKYVFDLCGTGWDLDGWDLGKYLSTVQDEEGYVWHIFYKKI